MSLPPDLQINPSFTLSRVDIDAQNHCLVLDDFLLHPQAAVDWVADNQQRFEQPERAYPGKVLALGAAEAESLSGFVRSRLSREFGFLRGGIDHFNQFCLTTLQPEAFSWIQQLPHSDPRLAPGRRNFASVLYLFRDPELGGTGFYRWRDPDYWQDLTARQGDDPGAGLDELRERFELFRRPPQYCTDSNEAVELLAMVPARFNRLIAYSGDVPHSAWISQPQRLVDDPRNGRLTLNGFASVWPR